MKQELLLKPRYPHTDAALEKAVRVVVVVAIAVYWVHAFVTRRAKP